MIEADIVRKKILDFMNVNYGKLTLKIADPDIISKGKFFKITGVEKVPERYHVIEEKLEKEPQGNVQKRYAELLNQLENVLGKNISNVKFINIVNSLYDAKAFLAVGEQLDLLKINTNSSEEYRERFSAINNKQELANAFKTEIANLEKSVKSELTKGLVKIEKTQKLKDIEKENNLTLVEKPSNNKPAIKVGDFVIKKQPESLSQKPDVIIAKSQDEVLQEVDSVIIKKQPAKSRLFFYKIENYYSTFVTFITLVGKCK
jgi:hypothetical protein